MNDQYDEFSDLLGVYALDAVDHDERERIELHLRDCPRCRAEVAEHREVAALLAQSGSAAPEGVWDRIVEELAPPPPALRMTFTPQPDPTSPPAADGGAPAAPPGPSPVVTPLAPRRRSRSRAMLAVLSAAAVIVAVLAVVAVGQSHRLDRLETALGQRSVESLANDAVAHSRLDASLTGPAGSAQAVVEANGQGYLIVDGLPTPPEGDVYQLWGQVDDTVLSLGTFGGDTSVVPFSVDPTRLDDVKLFAVTQERAPGVVASEQQAILAGTV